MNRGGHKWDLSVWPVPKVDSAQAAELGVRVEIREIWGPRYFGTKEALRACGVVPIGFALPGEEGSNRRGMRTVQLEDGRKLQCGRSGNKYWVDIQPSLADRERLWQQQQKRDTADRVETQELERLQRAERIETEAEDAKRRELDDLLFRIECFPRSAADFEQRALQIVWQKISAPLRLLKGELIPGCRIDEESVEDIVQQCNELYWRLAEAHFSVDRRALYELQAQASRRDRQFQEFMSTVLTLSKPKRTQAKQ